MRIWKRLLGTALCLCAAVCVMSVSAGAAEHSNHPICGDTTKCTNPDHSDGTHGGAVTWEAWNGTDGISYDSNNTAYVYLSGDAKPSSAIQVTDGKTLNLCLNGKKLSSTFTVIEVTGGATLNICDCQGRGIITPTGSTHAAIEVNPDRGNSTATLNLYGGEVSGNVCDSTLGGKSIIKLDSSYVGSTAVFNMYGGKVRNSHRDNSCYAVYVTHGSDCQINIYGGDVTCNKGDGIGVWNSGDAQVLIAGGTVTGGKYGVDLNSNNELTLSGSTAIVGDNAGIYLPSSSYFTVKDGFAVPDDGSISVMQALGTTNKGVIAKPEGSGSLADRARYFVSAEEGYFVESNNDGELQLTACAITKQPAVNDYTVAANGSDDKVKYQWHSVTKGDAPVTSKNATTANKFYNSGDDGDWNYGDPAEDGEPVTLPAFTLHMSQGDVLKLSVNYDVDFFTLIGPNGTEVSQDPSSSDDSYQYTAPEEGDYTLKVTAIPYEGSSGYSLMASFYAEVTADVLGGALANQVNTALDTSPLETGSYICQVTWENKTTRNSQAVHYTAPHTHSWSDAWEYDTYNHWHVCSICGAADTKAAHQWNEGEITTSATCTAAGEKTFTCTDCGRTKKETVSATGHNWSGEWTSDTTHHWHNCENENCPVKENSGKSDYAEHAGGAATCIAKAVCASCGTAYGAFDANGHDWGEWRVTKPATTSAAGEETRTCKRDASHKDTRAIPKLTPAPSGGGSSGGSSSTPAVTVPVSGSGDTVHVSASVSGSTAEVKEIKSAELDKIGTDSAVVIDLSGLNKGVTGVTLSTDTIDSICKTEADGVTIKLPSAELRVDRQTLAAVTEQAAGSKIRLVVEPDSTARGTMTAAQKSTLAGMKNAAALEAYFVSNDTRIHDFKGGSVELSIPYRAEGAIRAWFLKEDGTREPVSARYDKENAQLILHHFSHYVIEELDSSAAYTVCAKDDSCPLGAFGDLTAAAWYHDGVHYCLENGLMRGVSGGKFLPDGSTTRAQLVTILWRLEGSPKTTGAVGFGDTAGGAWYTEAVRWAAGCGVVKGYDNGRFGPNDAVTREQMAAILYRYAQHKGYDVSAGEDTNILSFDDAFAVSEYAIPAMQWACGSGMVRGIAQKGGMLLAPRDTTTRAQTATLLMRFQSAFAKEP